MGEETSIGWCHHTFSPWHGCQKVDELCKHCYAESFNKRVGRADWGAGSSRRFLSDDTWSGPLKWNAAAADAGERRRVFCASMADVFEDRVDLLPHRGRLWNLIEATPALDWLLLTKRPENFGRMLPWTMDPSLSPWPNVWLGVSAGTAKGWNTRWPILKRTPAAVRFVSMEPLLEAVDIRRGVGLAADRYDAEAAMTGAFPPGPFPDWIIVGGESGGKRRPMEMAWMESVVQMATAASVKVFVKQDAAFKPGQRGRISLPLWERKEFPTP